MSVRCISFFVLCVMLACGAACCMAGEVRVSDDAGVERALGTLMAGDTLILAAGEYRGGWTVSGLKGTEAAPIAIRGEPGAVIRASGSRDAIVFWGSPSSHVVIRNLRIEGALRGGIVVSGCSNITIRACTVISNGVWGVQTSLSSHVTVEGCELAWSRKEHGVYFSTTDYPAARDCVIHDNTGCGVHLNGDLSEGGDGMITGAVIERNVIFGNGRGGGAAINMDGVERSVVRDNRLHGNLAGGMVTFVQNGARAGAGNRFILNNVVFSAGTGRFGLGINGNAEGTVVEDNVLVCGKGPAIDIGEWPLAGFVSDSNRFTRLDGIPPIRVGGRDMGLAEWQRFSGQDGRSVVGGRMSEDRGRN